MTTRAAAARARRARLAATAAVAAAVVVADQVTKRLAVDHLSSGPVHLVGPLSLVLEYNTGVAFSLGAGSGWPVALATVGLVGVLLALARAARRRITAVALGLVLGGALGNLADRLFGGHGGAVVDFVHLGAWPTFNLADASVVVGCVILAVHLLRRRPAQGGEGHGTDGIAPSGSREPEEGKGEEGAVSMPVEDGATRVARR